MGFKEQIIQEFGLKQAESLEEIITKHSFFFDTGYKSKTEIPIYPVTKKANLANGLLNLYGTHWRYFFQEDWTLRKEDGDVEAVLESIRKGRKEHRFARYAFTQKYLDDKKSLWMFSPEGFGWGYYHELLWPMFMYDMEDYEAAKKKIRVKCT
jgi:hypothetical protein